MLIVTRRIWWELESEVLAFSWNGNYCQCDLCFYGGFCIEIVPKKVLAGIDELSFGIGWKITNEKIQLMQDKFKKHFKFDMQNRIKLGINRAGRNRFLYNRFIYTGLNGLTAEPIKNRAIMSSDGETQLGFAQPIGQPLDDFMAVEHHLLLVPLMRHHVGATLERYNQCLPYILSPYDRPLLCPLPGSRCEYHPLQRQERRICFSIRKEGGKDHNCGCTVCYLYPNICSCAFLEYREIGLKHGERVRRVHAKEAIKQFTETPRIVNDLKKLAANALGSIPKRHCVETALGRALISKYRGGDPWARYTGGALLLPLILWAHIGMFYLGADIIPQKEALKLCGQKGFKLLF